MGMLHGEAPAPCPRTPPLPGFEPVGADASVVPQWERADLAGLRVGRSRDFGGSHLALSLWHRLGLGQLLAGLLPAGRESVAWAHVAALLTIARFCGQHDCQVTPLFPPRPRPIVLLQSQAQPAPS